MNLQHHPRQRALLAFCLSALWGAVSSGAAEKLKLPEGFSLWRESASLRVGVGYKDNVTLSSFQPQGSAFEIASVEAMLYRLPWNNWQFSLMAMGSDARYFNRSIGIDTEQNAAATAQLTWFLGRDWRCVSTLDYIFLNQVMDVSATYGTAVRQEVFGHGLTFKEGVRKDMGKYWIELNLSGSRYSFREPLDDYWQAGPQLTLGRTYGHGSEISLSYQAIPVLYDTRQQTDLTGLPVANTHLRYLPQNAELSWVHFWDAKRRWRSTTRLGFETSADNGSGYFDYQQYRFSEQLRFRSSGWEFSLQAALAYYDFPSQPVSPADARARHRTSVQARLRGERSLSRHWRVYAAYDYERSLSNSSVEQYEANTVSGGVELTF